MQGQGQTWNKGHEVKMEKNRAAGRPELTFVVPFLVPQ